MAYYQAVPQENLELNMSSNTGRGGRTMGQNAELAEMIENLKRKNNQLERTAAKLGTAAETSDMRDRVAQLRAEGKKLCEQIIAAFKSNNQRGGDREVVKRLGSDFQKALEKFTQINQDIERTEEQIVRKMSQAGAGQQQQESPQYQQQPSQQWSAEEQDIATQLQVYDLEAIRLRTDGIKKIERDVNELHEIYRDLKLLVDEQQESLDTIEQNVTDARGQVENGQEQLLQAEEYQKKARKKQCCLLFIVLIVLAAIVLGVYYATKH